MKLSILICSLTERQDQLRSLLAVLNADKYADVEVLLDIDDRVKVIGQKRNDLLQLSQGDYVVFIDDDDLVDPDYIPEILKALDQNPDVVGINGIMSWPGSKSKPFLHSIRYGHWYEDNNNFYRTPNHWNPVKREYALRTMFKEINWGEDHDYSNRLYPLIQHGREVYIAKPIYFYQFDPKKSVASQRKKEDEVVV
ncbi:MAG TPA: glycosyltransferase [Planctomycetes bacterium]|nr:glycosyltransferase [Planctomycetota bacterium]